MYTTGDNNVSILNLLDALNFAGEHLERKRRQEGTPCSK
jgi:hypothetical protein